MSEKVKKAEYPMNSRGLGYRSTLETGPYFKDDVGYKEPLERDEYEYSFCGACAFYRLGNCLSLEEDVSMLASCKLYIDMRHELELRFESLMRMYNSTKDDSPETAYKSAEKVTIGDLIGDVEVLKLEEGELKAVNSAEAESKDMEVKFASMDEDRKIVYGIVLEPDEVDSHGDTVTAAEIEKAAHGYAMTPMVVGDGHVKKAKAQPIETFVYNSEVLKEVKEGSWVMAIKVHSDKIWEGIKKGDYTGFSIGAYVRRRPLEVEENDN